MGVRINVMSVDSKFDYEKIKDDRVFLYCEGRRVKVLKGREAIRFISKLEDSSKEEEQLLIAKVTGNFTRGNEKDVSEVVKT